MTGDERLGELSDDLARLGEELSEVAMDVLREALADGGDEAAARAKALERRLNRARAAVERAVVLLRGASGEPAGADTD